ncbi:hypothetical protein H5410_021370 [Solanum commersonii]|uniref:Ribosomal protein S13 n=1 Tax=Solanum commersonii TaxID=4109 RepID=A0A9J5ZB52_SOLCO|nr:hypothetical protein H5410_021370 [Solanum commersonii]
MLYISGDRLVGNEQKKLPQPKSIGIIKIRELTKYQIDQIELMLGQRSCCSLGIEEGRTNKN